jgi:CheY-like chemotaxis protein
MPLTAAVNYALEVCTPAVNQHEHHLTVTLPSEPIYLDADKTRLSQALCNLLTNAVKYSERGSRIWLTAERQGAEGQGAEGQGAVAVISVKDTGIGIPPHMLSRVFDLFTQVDRSLEKSQGGLGVGLTIVKRLVELHGGTVEARSEGYGRGAEFIIRLPVAQSTVHEEQSPNESQKAATPARRILVADDNVDAADSLALMLRLMGNEVRTAHDGVAAMEAAGEFRPDVVLLDIGMPRLNGYDTCRHIREQPWGKDLKLIALTGWGQEEDKRRSEEAGFDSHLVKPVEPAALENLLAESKS